MKVNTAKDTGATVTAWWQEIDNVFGTGYGHPLEDHEKVMCVHAINWLKRPIEPFAGMQCIWE